MADCLIILRQAVATRRRPNSTAVQRRANETAQARKFVISHFIFLYAFPLPSFSQDQNFSRGNQYCEIKVQNCNYIVIVYGIRIFYKN